MIPNLPYDVINKVPMTRWDGVAGAKLYLVNTMSEWRAFFELLMQQQIVCCDTETTGFHFFADCHVIGLSFGWQDTHFYIPLRHVASVLGGDPPPQINIVDIKDDLIRFFSQDSVFTVWHNYTFDAHFYLKEGVVIRTPFHDTRILWQFFDENAPGALKIIASGWRDTMRREHPGIVHPDANAKELEVDKWRADEAKARRGVVRAAVMARADDLETDIGFQMMDRRTLKKWIVDNEFQNHPYRDAKKQDINYGYVPVPLMVEYAALDTFLTWKVYSYVMANMPMSKALQSLYINELKLSKALFDSEEHGVRINKEHLRIAGEDLTRRAEALRQRIVDALNNENINLASVDELADALVEHGVDLTVRTGSGKLAVNKKILDKIKNNYEVVRDILEYRNVKKLKSTYVESILDKLTPDNILHASFNQNVTTGRMSSRDPNLQNIPGRDKVIRRAFVPWDDEYLYVFADYSQVEVRLTAHHSQDPLLLDAYAKNQDIHTRTMCEMFGIPLDYALEALKDDNHPKHNEYDLLRTISKRIVFGIVYGVGGKGLSQQIDRPEQYKRYSEDEWVKVCNDYIDDYLFKYIGVKRFINNSRRLVRQQGWLVNSFGRVRHLPHINATKIMQDRKYFWMEGSAERQGTNYLIQGDAADMFKISVVRIHDILRGTRSKMVSYVHDEIQFYMHKDELALLKPIKKAMEDFPFTVPIVVDISSSTVSWADKKKLDVSTL